jgi:hypothetical protein
MLGIGGGDPRSALLGPWTGGPPSMQPAPPSARDRGPLTFRPAPGLRKAPFAGPVWTEAGGETDVREPRRVVIHGAVAFAVYRVVWKWWIGGRGHGASILFRIRNEKNPEVARGPLSTVRGP